MAETVPFDRTALEHAWPILDDEERLEGLRLLPRVEAEDVFLSLSPREQAALLAAMAPRERRSWIRLLAPDDAADVIQAAPAELRDELLDLLDDITRREVRALLAYAEDDAGGLMSPRFARVRPDMTVDEAIRYLRRQVQRVETLYYVYVLDRQQRLLGVVSFRELFAAPPDALVRDIMHADVVAVREDTDQEEVARLFAEHDLLAIPVVDEQGRMKGLVTVDDIVDVLQEEATEDIQKIGGSEALDAPYFDTPLPRMVRKRAGWLAALFVSEMLTSTAMGYFEHTIQRAVVLALFVPLIISSGGNSGSQASTLIIRAMALGEVRLGDWWRVLRREAMSGLLLGAILGAIGFLRVAVVGGLTGAYGAHAGLLAAAIALAVLGVVLWGTLVGSMLPFLLRRLGFDPASASAPFVATLVDVTGIVIYFLVATTILRGSLL